MPFTKKMKRFLGRNGIVSGLSSHEIRCKRGQEQFDENSINTSESSKKTKKLSGGEQIAIGINC